ncbi:MAG TPA: hypothetical protein VNX47_03020, partial [Nevskia sp.]|nr:hypothetical protein [Nevskia sp.]
SLRRTFAGGCLPPGEAGCRSVQRQARDGLSLDPDAGEKRRGPLIALLLLAMRGAVPGWRRFLVTFWRCCQKVTRLQAKNHGFIPRRQCGA